jgi:uncharacterized protein YaiL (DUF2058 family)
MSTSLRDQLIQAGLVTEKQARLAAQQPRPPQQSRRKSAPLSAQQLAQQRAQAAKSARDQELNRAQQARAERAARLAVNATVRAQLQRAELSIVRSDARYAIVPAAVASRIGEREASLVMALPAVSAPPGEDDGYGAYAVPDDLVW